MSLVYVWCDNKSAMLCCERQRLADVFKGDHMRAEPRRDELSVHGMFAAQICLEVLEELRGAGEII